jgi:hypothetical protein
MRTRWPGWPAAAGLAAQFMAFLVTLSTLGWQHLKVP